MDGSGFIVTNIVKKDGKYNGLADGGRRLQLKAAYGVWQTEGGGSMAGNGGRGRGKGFVRLTRAGDGAPALKHTPAVLTEHPFPRAPL